MGIAMPRTIEHIVATHQHAQQLRSAGKPIWPYCVRFKSILQEDNANTSAEHLVGISHRIAMALKDQLPSRFLDFQSNDSDMDFIDLVDEMSEASIANFELEQKAGTAPIAVFNDWLTAVYDWCDSNRVYCG